ncbi:MAG: hypothetical protein H7Y03_04460 [Chitinophagaceae bacterium]|nr:hypothetical protein [Chitinophagaceae bacterium]
MNEMSRILEHLFKKQTLEEVPLSAVKELVERYPYFAAGQFLLAKKMKAEDDTGLFDQIQKTNLYFYNTLWLHFNLADRKPHTEENPDSTLEVLEPVEENSGDVDTPDASDSIAPFIESETVDEEQPIRASTPEISDAPQITHEEVAATAALEQTTAAIEPAATESGATAGKKDELVFDPYHTIDYFASLGIKLNQDPRPDDKLGMQLKSFTDWLKTMRKLPEATTETIEVNQADLNAHIEKIAAHSLLDKEVITQAMAEVLVMQGRRDKAKEIYQKLSLLNPGKSAYFASRIEELKQY